MNSAIVGIDWDEGNREHCQKHGVSLKEIEEALSGALYRFPDHGHSQIETRIRAIGKTKKGRHVFIVYTERTINSAIRLRPLSVRFMHQKEIDYYEKAANPDLRNR